MGKWFGWHSGEQAGGAFARTNPGEIVSAENSGPNSRLEGFVKRQFGRPRITQQRGVGRRSMGKILMIIHVEISKEGEVLRFRGFSKGGKFRTTRTARSDRYGEWVHGRILQLSTYREGVRRRSKRRRGWRTKSAPALTRPGRSIILTWGTPVRLFCMAAILYYVYRFTVDIGRLSKIIVKKWREG